MRFSTLHKVVAYLLSGFGLFALGLGSELDPIASALLFVGYVATWFVEGERLKKPSLARFWNGAVVAFFFLQVARGFLGAPLMPLGIEYAAFLQLSRLGHRRSATEYQHVAVLAFLHLIAATVLTTGLDYAVVFFGFVVVTPWMLALTHLRQEIEGNYGPSREEGIPAADAERVLSSRRVAGPRFLLGTALLSVPLFLVTAAFFLFIPRVGMGFLSFGDDTGRSVAGFGSDVSLGGFGVIRDDPTVVLRVSGASLPDPPPRQISMRLRGTSFDHYQDGRWTRSVTARPQQLPAFADFYPLGDRQRTADDQELTIVLDPLDEPVLFLPPRAIGLLIPPHVQAAREVPRRITRGEGTDVRYSDGQGLEQTYTVVLSRSAPLVSEGFDPEDRERYLALPPAQERIAALAAELTEGATDDEQRARRLLAYLRDSGELVYSLDQPDTHGEDPLHVFLFEAKRGHCEYFSTSLAVMLRTLGVPSRNVTGFVGGRYNDFGRYYAVRQGDAHSWVEAWIGGEWVTLDPTPPAARAEVGLPAEGFFTELRAFVDAMRIRWSRYVVGYDLRAQVDGLRRFWRWYREVRSGGEGASDEGRDGGRESASSGAGRDVPWGVVFGLIALALLALGARTVLRILGRRRRAPGDVERRQVVRLYLRLDQALSRAGRPRPEDRTPLEHAEALAGERFPEADAVAEVTRAYVAARFGGAPLPPAELARLDDLVRRVRHVKPLPRPPATH